MIVSLKSTSSNNRILIWKLLSRSYKLIYRIPLVHSSVTFIFTFITQS